MEVSDEQWAEARRLVDEGLPDSAGMSREKRDTITNLLAHGRLRTYHELMVGLPSAHGR